MREWQDLIKKAQNQDLHSFDILVRRFRDMAVAYAYSVLNDFHLAEDVAQEAFICAFRDLAMLKEPNAFPSWLRRLIFKQCNRITRKKKLPTVSVQNMEELPDRSDSQLEAMLKKERQDAVLNSIHSLPAAERVVTALFYINGYSMGEVGEFLAVPVSTIKSRLHSARKKLQGRMVEMVKETLHDCAPGNSFNDKVRAVLENVPQVSFELHRKKEKDGLRRCPESVPFPSCLRSCLDFLKDSRGYKIIQVGKQDWRLDKTYVYLMGNTGAAFRLSWKPDWQLDNPLIGNMTDDPLLPLRRGMESLGYDYEIIPKEQDRDQESYFRGRIIETVQKQGRPLIAQGVVGPPEECVISGFDQQGEILIGWSFFQKLKEFNADIEFEPHGYFRKRNWFKDTKLLLLIGYKQEAPDLSTQYRKALQWALELTSTALVRKEIHNGLAAYEAWAQAILNDTEFSNKKAKELRLRYDVHHDAVGTIAEGRWYAYQFIQMIIEEGLGPKQELSQAAQCYDDQHSSMWQIWGLVGGPGASAKKAKLFAAPAIRKKTADIILQARKKQRQAADYLAAALERW